jgi:endoglucanase
MKNFLILSVVLILSGAAEIFPAESAQEIVSRMKTGWNLGNTLDAFTQEKNGVESETCWGQPKTTRAMMKKIASAGFKTVRIPVTYHNHFSDGKIDPAWLERVKEICDYAMDENLFVILNIHHDTFDGRGNFRGYSLLDENRDDSVFFVKSVWSQAAGFFRDYGERLVFETLNEPRLIGHEHEWNFSRECSECFSAMKNLNDLNRVALDAIRKSGGKNSFRLVLLPSYAAAADSAMDPLFVFPDDFFAALSVHAYAPYSFAMKNPGEKKFSSAHRKELDSLFDRLDSAFVSKGIPVVIGEFGATNKNNKKERIAWANYFSGSAAKKGMALCLWDNGDFKTGGTYEEKFGSLDRKNLVWFDEDFIKAILSAQK